MCLYKEQQMQLVTRNIWSWVTIIERKSEVSLLTNQFIGSYIILQRSASELNVYNSRILHIIGETGPTGVPAAEKYRCVCGSENQEKIICFKRL